MHYKSKRSRGRLLLLALACLGILGIFWLNSGSDKFDENDVPVITPTSHLPIDEPTLEPESTLRAETVIIRAGDTLAKRLQKVGISPQVIHELQSTESAGAHLAKIYPGQVFTLSFTEDDELVRLEQKIDELKQLIIEKENEAYTARLEEKPITTYIKFASNTIDDSLFTAGSKVGLTDNMILQLAAIFQWDIDFSLDIQPGDSFAILYEDRYSDGEKISPGNIVAAQFTTASRTYEAVRFDDGKGFAEYYSPNGSSMRKAFLRSPVNFTRISSRFSLSRKHPILHTFRAHKGVDYAAPSGTPIRAAGDGKVIFKGVKSGYGNVIILQHGSQYSTLYAHMSRFAQNLKQGDKVRQDQTIGYVGMSGLATAPHLHYEFRINDIHKDPLTVALPQSQPIPSQYKNTFTTKAKTLLTQLDYHKQIEVATRDGAHE
jgi:murein DD-endopeptidase MepM/ murein hydrolase activator NlpD